jgi:hypothetical protein
MPSCTNLPKKHLVVYHKEPGPSSVIESSYLPLPTRREGQLLIKVRAISVNPKDWKSRKRSGSNKVLSCLGEDIAGDVIASDVHSSFQPGQRVYAMMNMLQWRGNTRFFKNDHSFIPFVSSRSTEKIAISEDGGRGEEEINIRWGASSEYTVIDERFVAQLPDSISYVDAASVPLASLTALQNLKKCGFSTSNKNSMNGRHILIHGKHNTIVLNETSVFNQLNCSFFCLFILHCSHLFQPVPVVSVHGQYNLHHGLVRTLVVLVLKTISILSKVWDVTDQLIITLNRLKRFTGVMYHHLILLWI